MRRKMGGMGLNYRATFQRLSVRTESGRRTSTPPRVSSAAASTPGRSTGQKGGRQNWCPAPVQGLAMAEGQDLSDTQGGLATASGPRVIVLQVDKKLLIKTDS